MGIIIRNTGQGGTIRFTSSGQGGRFNSVYVNPSLTTTTTTTTTTAGLLLLDAYSGGSAAFSLRKLRAAYAGSAIRVRRSSDNTEQDIGFVNNQLDTGSLLSFAGSQNLILYSEQFDQSSWTKGDVTVTSNQGVAPDGTTTADKVVIPNNSNGKALYQSFTAALNPITISIYAKAAGYNYAVLTMSYGNFSPRYSITVDLTNGNITKTAFVGSPTGTAQSVISVGNGWYRISVTMDAGGTSSHIFCPSPVSNPSQDATYLNVLEAGNGTDGILAWGAQVNYGYATTERYQVTTTSTNGGGFVTKWYDQSGNNRDAVQTTSTSQPRILCDYYFSGSLDKHTISFDGTDDKLTLQQDLTTPFSVFNVQRISSFPNNTNGSAFVGNLQNGGAYDGVTFGNSINNNYNVYTTVRIGGINYSTTSTTVDRNKFLQSTFAVANSFSSSLNGGSLSVLANSYSSHDTQITFGAARSGESQLYMRAFYGYEVILFSVTQSANRAAIESNINSHYSIY
jgi:hypothetical protein